MMKYPRTFHLPWSMNISNDDKVLKSTEYFEGKDIVITEKMDGENTTICFEKAYARSIDSNNHPSRDWIKALWARIRYDIPEGWKICGENMYARHSIGYTNLPSYFLVFAIISEKNQFLTWEETKIKCKQWNLQTVPEIWTGNYSEKEIRKFDDIVKTNKAEGYVIRNTKRFYHEEYQKNVAKFVRKYHVQTDEHWLIKKIIKNKLKTHV